ncbi:GNAT family N-acetyltransferase [Variovorax sp. UMC13]|uniref:GNAT family N-acetyltransferase n=1 Tax=Variovorax sp. UMC13 TaxID=1862326 RepID=UPI001600370F|nr:GNAT family N-acetyltransferase [Variovorax sp. UMC13]MBB1601419.1 GCN5 family acetyltransferase [Variovorax sp. UMC13]
MTPTPADIDTATDADLPGILELQAAHQIARGGMLSAEFPRLKIEQMMRTLPLVVARREGRVVGFLMAAERDMVAAPPVLRAMFAAYAGAPDAYVYGPICVDAAERGQGLAAAMFSKLRALQPGGEGVLFIRRDNEASLRAHRRMGMREVAGFELDGIGFAVFSYVG